MLLMLCMCVLLLMGDQAHPCATAGSWQPSQGALGGRSMGSRLCHSQHAVHDAGLLLLLVNALHLWHGGVGGDRSGAGRHHGMLRCLVCVEFWMCCNLEGQGAWCGCTHGHPWALQVLHASYSAHAWHAVSTQCVASQSPGKPARKALMLVYVHIQMLDGRTPSFGTVVNAAAVCCSSSKLA